MRHHLGRVQATDLAVVAGPGLALAWVVVSLPAAWDSEATVLLRHGALARGPVSVVLAFLLLFRLDIQNTL